MKVLIAGASGMIGTAAAAALRAGGHSAIPLVRPPQTARAGEVAWNPESAELDLRTAAGADAVVNLAGAGVGSERWSESRKKLLRSSRIDSTRALVAALAPLNPRPAALISASAVGIYGNRGDEPLDEASAPGQGFLAQLTREWEAENLRAETLGIRTVLLRFGVVWGPGGALAQMLGPFRMGLGGRLGTGHQWMPWIGLPDAVAMICAAVPSVAWQGIYNAVAPEPVTNAAFTRVLGHVVHRPAIFPIPAFAVRALFGEMADETLLASQRVRSNRVSRNGFAYSYPELEPALRNAVSAAR